MKRGSINSSSRGLLKPDEKARRILFQTYWSSSGWKDETSTAPDDYAYAKQAGYMFEPINITHDEVVDWLLDAREKVPVEQVADAFKASLTTRRLDLRSALGSCAFARNFPKHKLSDAPKFKTQSGNIQCLICGHYETSKEEDLNVLNFERCKWGGVRHTDPLYAAFDLTQFTKFESEAATDADEATLSGVIDAAATLPGDGRPGDLEKALASAIKSNKNERRVLIEILAYCGILQPTSHRGYFSGFPPQTERPLPPVHKIDWTYPVAWWRGSHGVCRAALDHYFPQASKKLS